MTCHLSSWKRKLFKILIEQHPDEALVKNTKKKVPVLSHGLNLASRGNLELIREWETFR